MMKLFNVLVFSLFVSYGSFGQITNCVVDSAGIYPCKNVDLIKYMPSSDIGGAGGVEGNDIWGWTEESSGREFVLMGLRTGTSFIEITDINNITYLGFLPTHSGNSSWRDIKVYKNHAFIVSEHPYHGIQIFDLTQLLSIGAPPVSFVNTAHFNFTPLGGRAHNIVINEVTGYVYIVGSQNSACGKEIVMINVNDPLNPIEEGCYNSVNPGYTHDAVCFIYQGPDTVHIGKEICIASNTNTQTIVDVTDKNNPEYISKRTYPSFHYTHQGWITDDHKYLVFNDEQDETEFGFNTRTHVMDISDLDNQNYLGFFESQLPAIDHNLYIKGQYAYQANYKAGLRILDLQNLNTLPPDSIKEVAYFDTDTTSNASAYGGSWGVYPYFKSGLVVMSNFYDGRGLYILRPNLPHFVMESVKEPKAECIAGTVVFDIDLTAYSGYSDMVDLSVTGVPAGSTATFSTNPVSPNGSTTLTISNLAAPVGNISLLVSGRGPANNSVHDIAVSYKVNDVPATVLLDTQTYTTDKVFSATTSIEIKNLNISSTGSLTLIAPNLNVTDLIQISAGGQVNYINESGCVQN